MQANTPIIGKITTTIKGRTEVGYVTHENTKTLVAYFPNIPNRPALTLKKHRCRGILGYRVA